LTLRAKQGKENMLEYKWSKLNHLQIGKYAEYFTKMNFILHGFDVYTTEVDDKGIDFVICRNRKYYEIQVKSIRESTKYVFMQKDKFDIDQDNLYLALIIFKDNSEPESYLIKSSEWKNENDLLKGKDYEGLKSIPEWGVNISNKNIPLLENYMMEKVVHTIGYN
jgi:hypothetical protein